MCSAGRRFCLPSGCSLLTRKREPEKCQRFRRAGATKKGLLAPFNPKGEGSHRKKLRFTPVRREDLLTVFRGSADLKPSHGAARAAKLPQRESQAGRFVAHSIRYKEKVCLRSAGGSPFGGEVDANVVSIDGDWRTPLALLLKFQVLIKQLCSRASSPSPVEVVKTGEVLTEGVRSKPLPESGPAERPAGLRQTRNYK